MGVWLPTAQRVHRDVQDVGNTGPRRWLSVTLAHSSGAATVEGTPTLAGAYGVTFAFARGSRTDTRTTTVNVACAAGHTELSDRSCEAPEATVHGLALSYDATVGELFSVGFTYEPEAAVLSVASVTPSGLAFTRRDTGRAVGLAGTPSLAGDYTVDLELRQPGRVDTHEFTIAAECREGHTELPDRSCEAPVCAASLGRGWVSSGTLEGSGSWESGCALPAGRRLGSGAYYAKHFRFSLLFDAVVTIDLTSSDEDAYLFLLEGYGAHGDEVDHDNDSGTGRNSKLSDLSLDAGAYTVAASTYHSERTGSFEVSLGAVVPLTVTDLDSHYSVTVGDAFSANFTYKPATARLGVSWYTPGMNLTLEDSAGDVDIAADTLTSAGTYRVILAFAQPGHTDYKLITIIATCPAGDTTAPDGACVARGTRPTVAAGCVTPDQAGWGRIVHSGSWTPECASTQMPASAAKYYRLDVRTPGRFDGGNLPVKIELASDPAASMFMLEGSDPATARLISFGPSAERTIVSGNTYGLPLGSYIIEVATSQPFNAGAGNNFSLAVQLPAGSEQHRDVQLLGNTGLDGDGPSLADFISRHPDATTVFGADIPYLDWRNDGCDGAQHRYTNWSAFPFRIEIISRSCSLRRQSCTTCIQLHQTRDRLWELS